MKVSAVDRTPLLSRLDTSAPTLTPGRLPSSPPAPAARVCRAEQKTNGCVACVQHPLEHRVMLRAHRPRPIYRDGRLVTTPRTTLLLCVGASELAHPQLFYSSGLREHTACYSTLSNRRHTSLHQRSQRTLFPSLPATPVAVVQSDVGWVIERYSACPAGCRASYWGVNARTGGYRRAQWSSSA
jgi:hypothetical protein